MPVTSSKAGFTLPFPSVINQGTALPCHPCGSSRISIAIAAVEINGYVPKCICTVVLMPVYSSKGGQTQWGVSQLCIMISAVQVLKKNTL